MSRTDGYMSIRQKAYIMFRVREQIFLDSFIKGINYHKAKKYIQNSFSPSLYPSFSLSNIEVDAVKVKPYSRNP